MKKIIRFFRTFFILNFYFFYDTRLRKGLVFGRASAPLKFSARFFPFWFGKQNYNNIMLQAKGISNDKDIKISNDGTFNFTRYFEKKLLLKISEILGLPFSTFSGYVTSGGTEANIYSMWIAREWAKSKGAEKTFWIIPDNAHYSIVKAILLLGIKNNSSDEIIKIETDKFGRADYKQIIDSIKKIKKNGNNPIILPLTVMTTECGAIDPVIEVNDFITKFNLENIFFHVDAAFSGFFLPFLEEYKNIFSLKSLFSITVDFSKTVGGPVGAGAVIFRLGLENYVAVNASYLSDSADHTLTGSRRGLDVLAMYGLLSTEEYKGIKDEVIDSLKKTTFLAKEISGIKYIKLFYQPELNYIVFSLLNAGADEDKIRQILKGYSISSSFVKIDGEDLELFKIIIRSDHKYKNIKKLVKDLKMAYEQK